MTRGELKEHYMPIIELAVTRTKEYYEAQLKAKESDLERQDMIIKCLNIDLDNKEKLLKAKDEKLQQINGAYAEVVLDFESAVMEIERLKAQLSSVHNLMYRNGYSDAIDCYDTFGKFNTKHKPNAKSRSIVAMLFWEWRKSEARIYATNIKWKTGRAFQSQILFEAAYKILKEQQ